MKNFFYLTIVILLGFCQFLTAQTISPFKENDRVVFLGNSITDAGHYHSYIWLYYMTRFPNMRLTIFNSGIGGDTAENMYNRLDGDVFNKRPTVIVTTFGMNDTGYSEYNQSGAEDFAYRRVKESREWFSKIEERYKKLPNTNIILMGSSPYDETAKISNNPFKNKNKAMLSIIDFQRKSAQENRWQFIDLNEPMTSINEQMQKSNPSFTLCGEDRIHPDNDGHMVMAYLFLRAQGFVGKEVAVMEIDASKTSVKSSTNCNISNLKKTSTGISFDYLAEALPYPLDTIARGWGQKRCQAKALEIVPFMQEMNREILQVSGLKGMYRLLIDEEEIGIWSDEDFSKGINLAALTNAPQYQQALAMMYLNEERWEIERRFRDYIWVQYMFFRDMGLLFADNREAIKVMNENLNKNGWLRARHDLYSKAMFPEIREIWINEMKLLVEKIYEINKPLKRKYSLIKQ